MLYIQYTTPLLFTTTIFIWFHHHVWCIHNAYRRDGVHGIILSTRTTFARLLNIAMRKGYNISMYNLLSADIFYSNRTSQSPQSPFTIYMRTYTRSIYALIKSRNYFYSIRIETLHSAPVCTLAGTQRATSIRLTTSHVFNPKLNCRKG